MNNALHITKNIQKCIVPWLFVVINVLRYAYMMKCSRDSCLQIHVHVTGYK